MDKQIERAFDKVKDRTKIVMLILSSCGGKADAMDKAIVVLRRIRQTHALFTIVQNGAMCGSACIPIFLQGTHRFGAPASVWLLHHSSGVAADGDTVAYLANPTVTERTFKEYFVPAGVSKRWLKKVRAKIKSGDYWQTGRDLWESKSGVLTTQLQDLEKRDKIKIQHFMPTVVCGDFCRG